MNQYHKIQTVFKRDPETSFKKLLLGEFSIPEFRYLQHNEWLFTEKVDGTNIRVMFDGETIFFGGKTNRAQIPAPLVNCLNEKFLPQLNLFQKTFSKNSKVCFYGEGYGEKIQSGGKYRKGQDFVLFDIKIDDWWLQRWDVEGIAEKFSINTVPIIDHGTLPDMVEKTSKGFKSKWGDFIAEGIVARPVIELKARNGERIITKIKHKDF